MKTFKNLTLLLALSITAFNCSSDDDNNNNNGGGSDNDNIVKSGILTEDQTWTADNIYELDGKVVVNEGVTLTINPGTIIKGGQGLESLASALVVDQGGKVIARGTADQPIIMTSVLDNIAVGQTSGSNLDQEDVGLWGGLIVLGRAPISVSGDVETAQIEGIPATEPYGQYGGDDANDNSGVYQYISVRHGGITIGSDNEINGITMGGVGAGTVMENLEVVANQDDGFEWFGGTVNGKNFITWANGDDGLDADQAWAGTIDNAMVIQGNQSGSGLELDGPEGSAATAATYTMKNITLKGNSEDNTKIADCRDGLLANLENVLVYNFGTESKINFNDDESVEDVNNNTLVFRNWEVVLPSEVTTLNEILSVNEDEVTVTLDESKFTDNASIIADPADATTGADTSVFGWSYTASHESL